MRFQSDEEAAEHLVARLSERKLGPPSAVIAVGPEAKRLAEALARHLGAESVVEEPPVARLRLPWYERVAFGALTADNHHYVDPVVAGDHSLGAREIAQQCRALLPSLRAAHWARRRSLAGGPALVASRGLLDGYRALSLCASAKAAGAPEVIVVSPCAAEDALERVRALHEVIVLHVERGPHFDPAQCFEPDGG